MLSLRVCGSPLNCLEYNQTGDMIAIGSQNGSIYLYRVSRDGFSYKKINKIRGSQPLTHIDWSIDGHYLQTATIDFDLLYWDVRGLTSEKSPIAMKDVKWLTHNCVVGFMVGGMWSNRYYSSQSALITTACRSGGLCDFISMYILAFVARFLTLGAIQRNSCS
jgi:microtubule-associated protein-like 1/2